MNSVYKFRSTDKFDYAQFLNQKAQEILSDSKKSLERNKINLTPSEEKILTNRLLNKIGLTLHLYYAGRITAKDVRNIRPKIEVKKDDK